MHANLIPRIMPFKSAFSSFTVINGVFFFRQPRTQNRKRKVLVWWSFIKNEKEIIGALVTIELRVRSRISKSNRDRCETTVSMQDGFKLNFQILPPQM